MARHLQDIDRHPRYMDIVQLHRLQRDQSIVSLIVAISIIKSDLFVGENKCRLFSLFVIVEQSSDELKVLPQFNVFTRQLFCENPKLSSIRYDMVAPLCKCVI